MQSADWHKYMFSNAPIGIARVSTDGHWLDVNTWLCEKLGYPRETLLGLHFQDITHPDDLESDLCAGAALIKAKEGDYKIPKRYICSDGSCLWAEVSVSYVPARRGEPAHFITVIQDTSHTHSTIERLHHLAHHDPLTKSLNRLGFEACIAQAFECYRATGKGFAVAFIDLDGFKAINDEFGHEVGDAVLKEVAQRLSAALRSQDAVARLGGDEFAVLLEAVTNQRDLAAAAQRLERCFHNEICAGLQRLRVTGSIGVSHCPNDAATLPEMLKLADAAMYNAKRMPTQIEHVG